MRATGWIIEGVLEEEEESAGGKGGEKEEKVWGEGDEDDIGICEFRANSMCLSHSLLDDLYFYGPSTLACNLGYEFAKEERKRKLHLVLREN